MPRATINIGDTVRKELRTCPGGYVELRKMSYGDYLHRQELAMQMQMEASAGKKEGVMSMKSAHVDVAVLDFQKCIAGHNLQDGNDQDLDFRGTSWVLQLDPRVGQEIGAYIDELNQLNDASVGNSSAGSVESSSAQEATQS